MSSLLLKFKDSDDVYHVDFAQSSKNVVSIKSDEQLPTIAPGFKIYRPESPDIVLGDYSEYTTIYRAIDKYNVQYSNDGSQYVPPVKDVTNQAIWNDQDNIMQIRPESIVVDGYCNGKKSGQDELKPSDKEWKNWKVIHHNKPLENVYTITAPDIPRYEKMVSGTIVYYTLAIPQPREITIDDLAECTLNSKSECKYNIYASYCEKNEKNFNDDVPASAQSKVNEVILADGFMVNEDGTCSVRPFNLD